MKITKQHTFQLWIDEGKQNRVMRIILEDTNLDEHTNEILDQMEAEHLGFTQ